MKQYQVVKLITANSVEEVFDVEKIGEIIQVTLKESISNSMGFIPERNNG